MRRRHFLKRMAASGALVGAGNALHGVVAAPLAYATSTTGGASEFAREFF